MSTEFGEFLVRLRRQTTDPLRGGILTQERLAELLYQYDPLHDYSAVTISNWEHDKNPIKQDRRDILTALIAVLNDCGGLQTVSEAQDFLYAGNYRELDEDEISRIDQGWLKQYRTLKRSSLDENRKPMGEHDKIKSNWSLRALITGALSNNINSQRRLRNESFPDLYPSTCGDNGINLDHQRLLVSSAFGTYFAGLLEQQHNYVELSGQIDCPAQPNMEILDPLERIYWTLQLPKGARVLIIAADAGMGKSTLAARIARCFYQEQALDLLLGDSAKNKRIDIVSAEVVSLDSDYYDVSSFYRKIAAQLGLPDNVYLHTAKQFISAVQERLAGRRALIIVDNLEDIQKGDALVRILAKITSRDVRAIITTRSVSGFGSLSGSNMVVHIKPLVTVQEAVQFLNWHIQQFLDEQPDLQQLREELTPSKRMQHVLERTGGIPLLMQLIFSDIARSSWNYVTSLPSLFSTDLLEYLYQSRWDELSSKGAAGFLSQKILVWVANEQYCGRTVTLRRLVNWSEQQETPESLSISLRQLQQRFLLTNSDKTAGNFAVFPSLADFLHNKR